MKKFFFLRKIFCIPWKNPYCQKQNIYFENLVYYNEKIGNTYIQYLLEQPEVSKKPSSQDKKAQPNETSEVDKAYANLKERAAALRE